MKTRPLPLMLTALSLVVLNVVVCAFLLVQGYVLASGVVGVLASLVVLGMFVFAMVRHQDVPWVATAGQYASGLTLALACLGVCVLMDWPDGVPVVVGFYVMGLSFFLGVRLIRLLLRSGHPILGVARTLVDESLRMRVPLVFLILMLFLVPSLPLVMDPEERLAYRVASFLSWAMLASSGLLSLLTVFLAVGTVATEFGQKQIYMTLTKPVSRWQYLLGKWLGIVLLNVLLVGISGAGIYTFTRLIASQPALDGRDRMAVDAQVLASRVAIGPEMSSPEAVQNQVRRQLLRLQAEDPAAYGDPVDPNDGEALQRALDRLSPEAVNRIRTIVIGEWLSIGPRSSRVYRFTDLLDARALGGNIQFRVEPNGRGPTPGGMVELRMRLNQRPYFSSVFPDGRIRLSEETFHVLDLPVEAIDDSGVLEIELINNLEGQASVSFSPADGMQLLYRVDTFENNFLRAMLLLWTRLAFTAMASLAAASFLGFPVACLLALLIYFGAATSAFLNEALVWFSDKPPADAGVVEVLLWYPAVIVAKLSEGEIVDAIKIVIRAIGLMFMSLVPSFSDYTANEPIAKGLHVGWGVVGMAFLWVSGIWTAVVFVAGYVMLRNREPAEVIV
ncbi:ABC transporter permease [Mucisphaera calidilacus]|uniref:ABC-2 family transporter protein n=1 Tax=Mucisphaera calidilacus TaxID=2527982 RepID=A0A518C0L6_9BACT|nr:ABC transporter permease [Mucisphaera calidilacus]QDU72759.1 ABC-2 family transporter protein [Mucisphaera calidilacus]